MTAKRVTGFSGQVPKVAPRLLADTQATIAQNVKLWSGEIEPVKESLLAYTSTKTGPLKSAIRLTSDAGADVWLAWNEDVNAVFGPVAGDTSQRTYYTGEGEPRVTNLSLAIQGGANNYPTAAYVLGIPRPETAPTVGHTGGSGTQEARSYVYTFVSKTTLPNGAELEEEGPPSPVTTYTGFANSTSFDLSNLETAPPNSGTISAVENSQPLAGYVRVTLDTVRYLRRGERIVFSGVGGMTSLNAAFKIEGVDAASGKVWVKLSTVQVYTSGGNWARQAPHNTGGMVKRVYRTDSTGTYKRVIDLPVATTTHSDIVTNTVLAGRATLASASWHQPPADMHSLIALPNGVLCGISGNQLCGSVPYQPHAWPPEWRKTANYQGVSLGNIGSIVVMTSEGRHYVANGVDPSVWTLDESKGRAYPCISKRSTVSMNDGVVWATHDGLAIQTAQGSALFTEGVFEYEEWQALGPTTMFGALYSGRYVAGFQRPGSDVQELLILDPSEQAFLVFGSVRANGLYADIRNGQLYVLLGQNVRVWDADPAARLSARWKSKEWVFPTPLLYSAAKVDADFALTPEEQDALAAQRTAAIAANQALINSATGWIGGALGDDELGGMEVADSPLQAVPPATYDQCWLYIYYRKMNAAGATLAFARQVKSNRAFRLKDGYKTDVYSAELITNVRVRSLVLGTSMDALKEA